MHHQLEKLCANNGQVNQRLGMQPYEPFRRRSRLAFARAVLIFELCSGALASLG